MNRRAHNHRDRISSRVSAERKIRMHEEKGDQAEKDKDHRLAHWHYQHADHFKRTLAGENQ